MPSIHPDRAEAFEQLRHDLADRNYNFTKVAHLCTQALKDAGWEDADAFVRPSNLRNYVYLYWGAEREPNHPKARLAMRMVRCILEKPTIQLIAV